jgi:hypothetical protein
MSKRKAKPLKAPKAAQAKVGRPSDYNAEVSAAICAKLADGESLRQICANENMPDKATVFRWLDLHRQFRDQYARARDLQAASYADDVVDIADTEVDPQKARVRIDARKWHASKLAPKKYGDFQRTELSTADDKPLRVDVTMTPAEAYARALKP